MFYINLEFLYNYAGFISINILILYLTYQVLLALLPSDIEWKGKVRQFYDLQKSKEVKGVSQMAQW